MNLTLKQLFKFAVVCTCACAINAFAATNYVEDAFEEYDGGSYGLAISQYKYTTEMVGLDEVTNYAWFAESGDASSIVSNDAAYSGITGSGPIDNPTAEMVLNLETEGNTLSRTAGVSIATSPRYIDTLVKFTPSEDDPAIDTSDVKVALYVNAESNLVVKHKAYNAGFTVFWETNSVLGAVDPDQWYRLTLESKVVFGVPGTKIYVDGVGQSHTNAYFESDFSLGGDFFCNIDTSSQIKLVSFQGTGLVDELVVSDTMPDFGSTAIMLTLFSADGMVTFDPVGPVTSGTEVTMTADDWYRVTSVSGPAEFTTVVAGLPADEVIETLEATASCVVTVETAVVTNDTTGVGGGTYDVYKVATWAIDNGVAEADPLDVALEDDYLLNVAPGTDSGLTIDAITVSGTTVSVVVSATEGAVDLADINGTLTLFASTTVDGTYTEVDSQEVSISGSGSTVTVDFTNITNPTDFFKAVVQ